MPLTGKKAIELYESKASEDGDAESLCFGKAVTQTRRLEAATAAMKSYPGSAKISRAIDLGAGLGDLSAYLPQTLDYIGVERIEWMVKSAHTKYGLNLVNEDIPKYLDLNMDQNPEGDIALFLLGVVATCDNRELADISTKVRAFRKVHKGPLILSWQDSSKYTGAFRSFSTQQIVDAFGASPYALLTPKDDTEVTGVFF